MVKSYTQLSDVELLAKVESGNTRAFGDLYLRHLDGIYRYLYYRVARNGPEAEDLAQEVFLRAWKAVTNSKRSSEATYFKALLYRIAHNLAVDRWRTEKNELSFEDENPGLKASQAGMPEDRILIDEQNQALMAAIRELKPILQDVFICRFINEMSHAETARVLKLKEGHVRVLQHRALKQIRITVEDS